MLPVLPRAYFAANVLAVHTTNTYLNLSPVVARLAESLGKRALLIEDQGESKEGTSSSSWVLVANNPESLDKPEFKNNGRLFRIDDDGEVWTDDYSNMLRILR
jgi:hypothetical protein